MASVARDSLGAAVYTNIRERPVYKVFSNKSCLPLYKTFIIKISGSGKSKMSLLSEDDEESVHPEGAPSRTHGGQTFPVSVLPSQVYTDGESHQAYKE